MKSELFKLNWNDFFKGLIVAVLSAVITFLYDLVQAGDFVLNAELLNKVLTVSASALLAYLLKNLFTNSSDKVLKKERK